MRCVEIIFGLIILWGFADFSFSNKFHEDSNVSEIERLPTQTNTSLI